MKRLAALLLMSISGLALAEPEPGQKLPEPAKTAAASKRLSAGDPAPALSVEKWIKGEPVKKFEKDKTYIVEFWATWCGPCIASMPHLSQIQKKYKDKGLTIIGMTSGDPNGNTLEAATKMAIEKGDGMGYTVAWDKGRETDKAYMVAAGEGGIPCSFVVDKASNIAYIGHPMFLDMVVPKVVDGTWDIKKGNAEVAEARKAMEKVYGQFRTGPEAALASLKEFEAKYPLVAEQMQSLKYRLQLDTGDTKGAAATAKHLYEQAVEHKDAESLNALAWEIVAPDSEVKDKDLDFALKCAEEAAKITERKDAMILDTLGRAHFAKGNKEKAIAAAKEAIALAPEDLKKDFEAALAEYEAAK